MSQKRLLNQGVELLNKLNCDWGSSNLQNLLIYYNLCKNDSAKLKKAIKVLRGLSSFVSQTDVAKMKKISNHNLSNNNAD